MDCSSLQHQVLFMYAYHHSSTKYLHSLHCTKAISIYQWKGKRSKCASFKWPYIFTLVWYNYRIRIFQSIYFFSWNWQPLHTVNITLRELNGIQWMQMRTCKAQSCMVRLRVRIRKSIYFSFSALWTMAKCWVVHADFLDTRKWRKCIYNHFSMNYSVNIKLHIIRSFIHGWVHLPFVTIETWD